METWHKQGIDRELLTVTQPADGASLLAGLERYAAGRATATGQPGAATAGARDREDGARFDVAALRPFLRALDLVAVARGMPRVLLAHARDDADVPFAHSERLAAVLAPPTRFIALETGGHHGPGRSPLVARATVDWVKAHGA